MAELWIGAHPLAPSLVRAGDARVPLDRLVERDPEGVLGLSAARAFQGRLPFLFKVLAARVPLSIQVHPDADQAREGFEREDRAGLAPDDPTRSYRDPFHKPELLCALTRFHALKGFRPVEEILPLLQGFVPEGLAGGIRDLRDRPHSEGLRAVVGRVLGMEEEQRRGVIQEALGAAGTTGEEGDRVRSWMRRLAREFPGDAGVLAPLLMNLVTLEPGEALSIAPGELHAYLEGTGLEVMANSDNVIRGGLTPKPVDRDGLLRVARFLPEPVRPVGPEQAGQGLALYPSDAAEFSLGRIRAAPGRPFEGGENRGVEIHLCLRGEGAFLDARDGDAVRFSRGDALLVPARAPGYRVEGDALLFRASVPGCDCS
jgi:mannose-6-phosphate isomerase